MTEDPKHEAKISLTGSLKMTVRGPDGKIKEVKELKVKGPND